MGHIRAACCVAGRNVISEIHDAVACRIGMNRVITARTDPQTARAYWTMSRGDSERAFRAARRHSRLVRVLAHRAFRSRWWSASSPSS